MTEQPILPENITVKIFPSNRYACVWLTCSYVLITALGIRLHTLAIEGRTNISMELQMWDIPIRNIQRIEYVYIRQSEIRITISQELYERTFC